MADALGPNAQSVVDVAPTLQSRFRFNPLSAERLVSVGGSYAFGLRLDGIDGSSLREALMRAGGHRKKSEEGLDLVDVGPYAQVPEPLLRAGVFGLGARDAFTPDFTVLAISANSRAALLGHAGRLIDQPIYRAAAECLGDVVAARMVPERLLLSVEVGIDLVAAGIARDREVLCVLGGTSERARRTAAALRGALAPAARDPRTGQPLSEMVERGAEVETSTYEGVAVVRAEVTPVAGRRGFFFGTIARGQPGPDDQCAIGRAESQAATASPTAPVSAFRPWSPATLTTLRSGPSGGMPKRSLFPCTTSTGTSTASSSGRRLCGGLSPLRGGRSGKARQRTASPPVSCTVRHATRAPRERPPTTSGRPSSSSAPQLLDHRHPCLVETLGRSGRAPARDAVGLLDQRHCEACAHRGIPRRDQIGRLDPSAGTVAQDNPSRRSCGGEQVGAGGTGGSVELDGSQSTSGSGYACGGVARP